MGASIVDFDTRTRQRLATLLARVITDATPTEATTALRIAEAVHHGHIRPIDGYHAIAHIRRHQQAQNAA